jgi:hypothetical protein
MTPSIRAILKGMPREDLYELRVTQIVQYPEKVLVLYTNGRVWRVIWTDGRDFPKDPEPRWFGYSIGKWVNDTTLLVETRGVDDRTWVDRAGRPHSLDLAVKGVVSSRGSEPPAAVDTD